MLDSIPISIEIEIGRRHKIIKTDRICTFCFNQGENVIEDEFHFIMECNLYVDLRRKYLREHTVQKNMNSFIQLMSCKNIHIINNLAMYIYIIPLEKGTCILIKVYINQDLV